MRKNTAKVPGKTQQNSVQPYRRILDGSSQEFYITDSLQNPAGTFLQHRTRWVAIL
jgi:hypothetical protein